MLCWGESFGILIQLNEINCTKQSNKNKYKHSLVFNGYTGSKIVSNNLKKGSSNNYSQIKNSKSQALFNLKWYKQGYKLIKGVQYNGSGLFVPNKTNRTQNMSNQHISPHECITHFMHSSHLYPLLSILISKQTKGNSTHFTQVTTLFMP